MNASLVVWIFGVSMLLIFRAPHYPWDSDPTRMCGPYASLESWQEPLQKFIAENSVLFVIQYCINLYPFIIVMVLWLWVLATFKSNENEILDRNVNESVRDFQAE